jgi:outer membrane murein-binding lipoprotein Lpp
MRYMINRLAPVVVILLSAFVLAGCSAVFGENPREQADQAISNANKSIAQHNELFEDARSTYADVKQKIESGEDPSKEKDNIAEAKNTLEEARTYLQDAAEAKEIEFYGILEEDPALQENREEALDLLSEVGEGYQKAKKIYDEAHDVANAHPRLIQPAPE